MATYTVRSGSLMSLSRWMRAPSYSSTWLLISPEDPPLHQVEVRHGGLLSDRGHAEDRSQQDCNRSSSCGTGLGSGDGYGDGPQPCAVFEGAQVHAGVVEEPEPVRE